MYGGLKYQRGLGSRGKPGDLKKKRGKGLELIFFSKESIQMPSKHMKRWSTPLLFREMPIKPKVSYDLTFISYDCNKKHRRQLALRLELMSFLVDV